MALEALADESLVLALSHLPARGITQCGACSRRLAIASRADRLWLPLADRRWRFGGVPTTRAALPPGRREAEYEAAIADAAQARPGNSAAGAFAFFVQRCRQDMQAATLVLQLSAAPRGPPEDASHVHVGAVVRLAGLATRPQLNGCIGVVCGELASAEDRVSVTLAASLQSLSVRRSNLCLVRPAVTAKEAEREAAALGTEAVDALGRLATAEGGPALELAARGLLARTTEQWAVAQWEDLVADQERADLLEEGGLVVSQWADPLGADVKAVRSMLAQLADAVEARVAADAPLRDRIASVGQVLFDEFGFRGNKEQYYDPRNSFLHSVLARRLGIPISLCIVWAAVARRVKVPCFLCTNMPAHIVIRVSTGGTGPRDDLYVDAFGPEVMDFSGLVAFARAQGIGFEEHYVQQRPATAIYARLLRNLRNIYQEEASRARDPASALAAQRLLAAVCSQTIAISSSSPASAQEVAEVERVRYLRDQVRALTEDIAAGPRKRCR